MTEQLALWTSDFGRIYTDRNDRELGGRVTAWREMVSGLPIERILEVGCNVGWNLSYLSRVGDYELVGVEPQSYAIERARMARPQFEFVQGDAFELPFEDDSFDLVFTCGVLIHIDAERLGDALDEIYRVSRRYVLYVEYDAADEVEIPYRGEGEALWKRDHRAAWTGRFPDLEVVRSGFWGGAHEFDDCTFAMFRK